LQIALDRPEKEVYRASTLTRLLKAFKLFALIICCIVLWDVHGLIRDARVTIRGADPILGNINQAAADLSGMTKVAGSAMAAETGKIDVTIDEARKDGRASRAALDSFRQVLIDVHQQVVPQAMQTLQHFDSNESLLMEELKPPIFNLNRGAAALADAASDPSIKLSLANAADATGSGALAMKHLEGITLDGQQVADQFRTTYLKPQKFAWALLKELIGLGGSMAQMVK